MWRLGRDFDWHALLPVTRDQLKVEYRDRAENYLPQDPEEKQLVDEWFAIYGKRLPTDENSPEAWQPPTFSRPNTDKNGRRVYQYYQPMYAE